MWRHLVPPWLRMRTFSTPSSKAISTRPCRTSSPASASLRQLEGRDLWCFDRIEGDYFSILGMLRQPLLQWGCGDRGTIPA